MVNNYNNHTYALDSNQCVISSDSPYFDINI